MPAPLSRRRFFKTSALSALGISMSWIHQGCRDRSLPLDEMPEPLQSSKLESGSAIAPSNMPYANGGTVAMATDYPNPFGDSQPNCILTCAQTQGPCYVPTMPNRQDISEGETGLPLRLAFQLVQAQTCAPVADAQVELWQTNAQGLYSGKTSAQMCHGRDRTKAQAAAKATFLRGSQTSDSQGYLAFHSIYPGWYPGRTPHLHLQITIDGEIFVITQLYFNDQLSQAIYRGHPDYRDRGPADTLNPQDGIFNRGDSSALQLQHQVMDDGILLAYKTLGLRKSIDESLCGKQLSQRK